MVRREESLKPEGKACGGMRAGVVGHRGGGGRRRVCKVTEEGGREEGRKGGPPRSRGAGGQGSRCGMPIGLLP